jgi:hypothetical protein
MIRFKSLAFAAAATASLLLSSAFALADEASQSAPSPNDHAPAGVMFDHMHKAGEFMIGYRYMFDYSGDTMLSGTNKVDDMALAHAGFSSTPERMTMHMHMLDLMYAPADWLTLMLMPQYMSMNMDMRAVEGAEDHGGEHGGHAGGMHSHGTAGIGDTIGMALVRIFEDETQHMHLSLGLSAPTGSVSERIEGETYTHYMMQLGSGTWDFLPGITYTGHRNAWSWGAQLGANIKLEERNESGFRFGDRYQASVWGSRTLTDWLSGSARLIYSTQGDISGHYNRPHSHTSPPDLQANYGGDFLDIGLGLNAVATTGALAGHRIGLEWLIPVHQNVNGFQARRDGALHLSWSKAF